MARRRFGRRSRGGSKFFGLGTKGLVSLGVMGALAGGMFGDTIGNMIPVVNQQNSLVKSAVGGFVIGGPAGAVLSVAKGYLMPSAGSNTVVGAGAW